VNVALQGLVLESLPAAVAAKRLGEAVFGPTSPKASTAFWGDMAGRRPDGAELRARCEYLAGEIPCLDCHVGEGPYAGGLEGLLSLVGRSV